MGIINTLANWESISMPKEYGGLRILNLRDLNMRLLSSWLNRYNHAGNKLWRSLLDFKYNTSKPKILCCKDVGASQFFKRIMWPAKAARIGFRWKVGNGKKKSSSGRTIGWVIRVLLSSSGTYM